MEISRLALNSQNAPASSNFNTSKAAGPTVQHKHTIIGAAQRDKQRDCTMTENELQDKIKKHKDKAESADCASTLCCLASGGAGAAAATATGPAALVGCVAMLMGIALSQGAGRKADRHKIAASKLEEQLKEMSNVQEQRRQDEKTITY